MSGMALEVFRAARAALEAAGIPHALVGATALGRFTLPRATLDMDFLVGDERGDLPRRLPGLQLLERARDAYFEQDAYLFEVPTYPTPVELFVATHPLTRAALARREMADLPPFGKVPLLRVEDTLLLKALVAAHPARPPWKRDLDRGDLRMLASSGTLIDLDVVRASLPRLSPAARQMLAEAGLG